MQQIQWFPGHMAKTERQISADIRLVDVVIELLDARIPISSSNPRLPELIGNKKRLILLNKSDLADKKENELWQAYFSSRKISSLCVNATSNNRYTKSIHSAILTLCAEKFERNKRRGIQNTTVKAMVVGIPNVGKSTLINSISNKAAAKTGNKPGVTKSNQWIRLNKDIELLDTPGILWPKFESETVGRHLAFIGSIKDDIIDIGTLVFHLIEVLQTEHKGLLFQRYGVDEEQPALSVLEEIARKKMCLKKGGELNLDTASRMVVDDFRKAKLGTVTLERVIDYAE